MLPLLSHLMRFNGLKQVSRVFKEVEQDSRPVSRTWSPRKGGNIGVVIGQIKIDSNRYNKFPSIGTGYCRPTSKNVGPFRLIAVSCRRQLRLLQY